MGALRKWLVPFVAVASIGLIGVESTTTAGAAKPPPHFFDVDSDGLVVNRRPSNTAFVATGNDAYYAEDTRDATAGYDQGFRAQAGPNTTQTMRRVTQWPADDSRLETIATASGFLTSFESPDLVVLRGDSGRWTPALTTGWNLVWYGQQQQGLSTGYVIGRGSAVGDPVGVQIVPGASGLSESYVLLATTRGLYVYTTTCTEPATCTTGFQLRAQKVYPDGVRVLAVHHAPAWAVTPFENSKELPETVGMFGVLTSTGTPTQQTLGVDFLRVNNLTAQTPTIGFALDFLGVNLWPVRGTEPLGAVPTGGDLRYGVGSQSGLPGFVLPSVDLRVDVNVTLADRSTRQYSGNQRNPTNSGGLLLYREPSACPSPATGFDAAYFDAVTVTRPLEAHVSCVAPSGGNEVVIGGYGTAGLYDGPHGPDTGYNYYEAFPFRRLASAGAVAVRPQVSVTLPCVQELRYKLREDNPSQTGTFSYASIQEQRDRDVEFLAGHPSWSTTYRCSAVPGSSGVIGTAPMARYEYGGNHQITITDNGAPAGSAMLGSLTQATTSQILTQSVGMKNVVGNDPQPGWQVEGYRPFVTSTAMAAGSFLTKLPTVDTIERIRLTGDSTYCVSSASAEQKLTCAPELTTSAPVPIAVMAAPPYVATSGQRAEITPEFATSSEATQTGAQATSTSVGVEVEQTFEVEDPFLDLASVTISRGLGYERSKEHSTSTSITVSKANGYGGSIEEDTVVTNLARYLTYTGVVVTSTNGLGLCDRADPSQACRPNATTVRFPIGTTVTSQTVNDLQAQDALAAEEGGRWWGPDRPFGQGLAATLTHRGGMPGTYLGNQTVGPGDDPDRVVNDYCIGDLDPRRGYAEVAQGAPSPANPFSGIPELSPDAPQILVSDWRIATAGTGITSQRANLEFGKENGEGFLQENTISGSVSVSAEMGKGVKVGAGVTLSAAGSYSDSFESSLGSGTGFSGTVGSLPDPRLGNEQFEWRMVVCKRELTPGLPVWVQNYQVRNYRGVFEQAPPEGGKEPEELGPVSGTWPIQSNLSSVTPTFIWQQPEGTVKSYDLELEAVGVNDHRYQPAVGTYENYGAEPYTDADRTKDTYADYAAASMRPTEISYTLPAAQKLRPGQVYRWRVVSNNFFFKTETSEWQYFVTTPAVSIGDTSVVEGSSGNRAARFTVSMAEPMLQDVPFHYGTQRRGEGAPGVDFTAVEGEGVIPAGATSVAVLVPVRGDTAVEGDEFFQVVLDPDYPATFGKTIGVGSIMDDDPPRGAGVSVGDASVVEGRSGDRFLRFTVSRHNPTADPVTVSYVTGPGTATPGSDFVAKSGTVTIGADATSAVLRIRVRPDSRKEADETMTVWLTSPTGGAAYRFAGIGTILDDD